MVEVCCGEAPSLVGRGLWLLCLLRGSGGEAGRVEAGGGRISAALPREAAPHKPPPEGEEVIQFFLRIGDGQLLPVSDPQKEPYDTCMVLG